MPPARRADPAATRAAVLAVEGWLRDATTPAPSRSALADAVRLTARTLAQHAPGGTVEVRVPPFVAVQCVAGASHTRGTPPNVVETDPRTWLLLATGLADFAEEVRNGRAEASGARAAEVARLLPVVPL